MNPYTSRRWNLNPVRLPISPLPQPVYPNRKPPLWKSRAAHPRKAVSSIGMGRPHGLRGMFGRKKCPDHRRNRPKPKRYLPRGREVDHWIDRDNSSQREPKTRVSSPLKLSTIQNYWHVTGKKPPRMRPHPPRLRDLGSCVD